MTKWFSDTSDSGIRVDDLLMFYHNDWSNITTNNQTRLPLAPQGPLVYTVRPDLSTSNPNRNVMRHAVVTARPGLSMTTSLSSTYFAGTEEYAVNHITQSMKQLGYTLAAGGKDPITPDDSKRTWKLAPVRLMGPNDSWPGGANWDFAQQKPTGYSVPYTVSFSQEGMPNPEALGGKPLMNKDDAGNWLAFTYSVPALGSGTYDYQPSLPPDADHADVNASTNLGKAAVSASTIRVTYPRVDYSTQGARLTAWLATHGGKNWVRLNHNIPQGVVLQDRPYNKGGYWIINVRSAARPTQSGVYRSRDGITWEYLSQFGTAPSFVGWGKSTLCIDGSVTADGGSTFVSLGNPPGWSAPVAGDSYKRLRFRELRDGTWICWYNTNMDYETVETNTGYTNLGTFKVNRLRLFRKNLGDTAWTELTNLVAKSVALDLVAVNGDTGTLVAFGYQGVVTARTDANNFTWKWRYVRMRSVDLGISFDIKEMPAFNPFGASSSEYAILNDQYVNDRKASARNFVVAKTSANDMAATAIRVHSMGGNVFLSDYSASNSLRPYVTTTTGVRYTACVPGYDPARFADQSYLAQLAAQNTYVYQYQGRYVIYGNAGQPYAVPDGNYDYDRNPNGLKLPPWKFTLQKSGARFDPQPTANTNYVSTNDGDTWRWLTLADNIIGTPIPKA